jgi:hypothetical protein
VYFLIQGKKTSRKKILKILTKKANKALERRVIRLSGLYLFWLIFVPCEPLMLFFLYVLVKLSIASKILCFFLYKNNSFLITM